MHKLYDDLAEEVEGYVDELAERVTQLSGVRHGHRPDGRRQLAPAGVPNDATDGLDTVKELVARYAAYAATTRAAIDEADKSGDMATADLFTEVSRGIDKGLWFLEAHLQK